LGLLLVAAMVVPALFRAKAYTGPGIHGNLVALEVAKSQWMADHKGVDAWLTRQDLLPYLTRHTQWTSFDQAIRRTPAGEIYIVNRTGAPVYAYVPGSERLLCVDSNDWKLVEQMK
jgi:hypothetical protein